MVYDENEWNGYGQPISMADENDKVSKDTSDHNDYAHKYTVIIAIILVILAMVMLFVR